MANITGSEDGKGSSDGHDSTNGKVVANGIPSAVIVTESRAATEARVATLRAQLTVDAAKLLNPNMAKVLVPILLQAIEAALKAKLWAGENPTTAIAIGGAALTVILMPILGPALLSAIGFSSGGVVAGSIAAAIHSAIGNVAAGSIFAALQAAGATGLIPAVGFLVGGAVGGAGAAGGKKAYDILKTFDLGTKAALAGRVLQDAALNVAVLTAAPFGMFFMTRRRAMEMRNGGRGLFYPELERYAYPAGRGTAGNSGSSIAQRWRGMWNKSKGE
ncbi:hypothetical protein K523DRAFT_62407 [Schizophyllum commune Tattone D]|nr:hypothetical protein K523DRAFT_62407 [Schizophyllum commune Tattone D]